MTNNQTELISELFGSETRAKILKTLILNSENQYSTTELSKITELDSGGIHREISNLVLLNLVIANQPSGSPKYQINKNHVFFSGLTEIFKKSLIFSDFFFVLEEIPNGSPLLICDYLNVDKVNNYLSKQGFKSRISKTITIYKESQGDICFLNKEIKELEKEILQELIKNPDKGLEHTKEIISLSSNLSKLADKIEEGDYAKLSKEEMLKLLKEYFLAYEEMHVQGWFQNKSDTPDMFFSKHLISTLKEITRKSGSLINAQDAFSKLTTPVEDSTIQKEYEDLLRILIEINSNEKIKNIFKDFESRNILKQIQNTPISKTIFKHTQEYGWLGYGYSGPNWDELYFIDLLSSMIRQNLNPKKLLEENQIKKEQLIKDQEKIIKSLNLNDNLKKLFEVARGFVFSKGYRKDCMFKYFSRIESLHKEIAKRLYASINDVRYLYPHEFENFMKGDSALINKIRNRQKFGICESTGKYEDDLYLEGDKAKNHIEKLNWEKQESLDVSSLSGTCACPGRVRGNVKIINVPADMKKMQKGDVLISIATNPDLVPAMKIASAIVTDVGGITCHAAIVSRELNIPCIVGTKIATKALKDGYLVEVDATHGIVKIIKK